MTYVLTFLMIQTLISAFITLSQPELKEPPFGEQTKPAEYRIRAARNLGYALLFIMFGWFEFFGMFACALAIGLLVELVIVVKCLLTEENTRYLSPTKLIPHLLFIMNFGVISVFLTAVLYQWLEQPTYIQFTYYGWQSWVITLCALIALISALKNGQKTKVSKPRDYSFQVFEKYRGTTKNVLITGGSGFIGKRLVTVLLALGHNVMILTRNAPKAAHNLHGVITYVNDLEQLPATSRIHIIINLAGEPLAEHRWTKRIKKKFVKSRITTTVNIHRLINRLQQKPELLINGSAIGYYGPHGDEELAEESACTPCFSNHLCTSWEHEALKIESQTGIRVCLLRIGIVLGQDGGPLTQLRQSFDFGLAAQIGDGKQWMSWIHRDDLIAMMLHLMVSPSARGPYNGTAPTPVTNTEFMCILSRFLPTWISVAIPAKILKLLVGEMAQEILLTGQRVIPERIKQLEFEFNYPDLHHTLDHLINAPTNH
ncbi:TIGR01777 family oxidoreductase [Litoribacillus peritrichatus]|uniref:TIGR01777 family oxidoreductase n=1 Tax=Litoribacillus peritrichatus TaxID=718191 RepID=A0ABP7MTT5_9GAMM